MQFSAPPPGLLTPTGSGYVGTWQLDFVEGIGAGQAASWVNASLNDSRGWPRAGVTSQQVASGGSVSVHVVNNLSYGGNPDVIGLTWHYSDGSCKVELEAQQYANADVVVHEFAHAYFYMEHSPEGSDSVCEPVDEPGDEWPSAIDIAQVRAWLGLAPNPDDGGTPEIPQTFWFPGDLDSYITRWVVPTGARARMTCVVLNPAAALIKPVFSSDYDALIGGDYEVFCRGIGTDTAGFFRTEWQDARGTGDIYVGIVVDAEAGVTLEDLAIGLVEVQISNTGQPDSARTIAN